MCKKDPFSFILRGKSELGETLTVEDFAILCLLGVGTNGVVKLAKHKWTGTLVALKVVSKEQIVTTRQAQHMVRERAVHVQLQHPLVAQLYGTFQDDDCLYLVLEYLPGGELWSLVYFRGERYPDKVETVKVASLVLHQTLNHEKDELRMIKLDSRAKPMSAERFMAMQPRTLMASELGTLRSHFGGLKEKHAVFYLGCVLITLEYLHGLGLLYRDLKLENLVLDKNGYVKIVDFGFAKLDARPVEESHAQTQKSHNLTHCGSIDYMAPEVLLHRPYDQRVDLWSFGILVYELLLGKTPFYHDNSRELGRKIITETVEFPAEFEVECPLACDLINQLLVKNPDKRLSSVHKIKNHRYFARVFSCPEDWNQLLRQERDAPYIPRLNGPFDTSFFQHNADKYQENIDAYVAPYFEDGSYIFSDF